MARRSTPDAAPIAGTIKDRWSKPAMTTTMGTASALPDVEHQAQ